MAITPEIKLLSRRLHQELDKTEQEVILGLNRIEPLLSVFPDNSMLISYFAYFNNVRFFVENSKRQIQTTIEIISIENITNMEIQEAGKDLEEILNQMLKNKKCFSRIIRTLDELP